MTLDVDAGERVDGTTIPLGLDTPLAVIGYLHGVGRRLADADAQDRSTLLGDASCPGKMDEGRENERGAIREAHLTGQQQAALQRLHLREELPRRAGALKRWLVAHGDAPRENGSRGNPLDVRAEDGPDTAPHIRTSTWREFNWKARSGYRLTLIDLIRHTDAPSPRSIDERIPRDLETIVIKAIDNDPMRRTRRPTSRERTCSAVSTTNQSRPAGLGRRKGWAAGAGATPRWRA